MAGDLVTISGFQFLHEAEAARMFLEAEGIQAFLADAETVNTDWALGNALGYIKIQVPANQSAAAIASLATLQAERAARSETMDGAGECLACGANIPTMSLRCTVCDWSYADDEDGLSEQRAAGENVTIEPEPAGASTMDRFNTLKRPVLLFFLWPVFLMLGLLVLGSLG